LHPESEGEGGGKKEEPKARPMLYGRNAKRWHP